MRKFVQIKLFYCASFSRNFRLNAQLQVWAEREICCLFLIKAAAKESKLVLFIFRLNVYINFYIVKSEGNQLQNNAN